jgi:hypothetical protein
MDKMNASKENYIQKNNEVKCEFERLEVERGELLTDIENVSLPPSPSPSPFSF